MVRRQHVGRSSFERTYGRIESARRWSEEPPSGRSLLVDRQHLLVQQELLLQ